MIYFTSDLHFGHRNVINLCNRPFKTVEEMDKTLITNWNLRVKDTDEVYILGDISLTRQWGMVYKYLKQLKGNKYLIRGNHDKFVNDPKFMRHYFEFIKDYYEIKYNEHSFVLFHYPMVDWNGKFHGTIQLYGHIHAKDSTFLQEQFGRCYHVGIDSNSYAPISIDEVITRMEHVNRVGFIDDLYQEAKVSVWHQACNDKDFEQE